MNIICAYTSASTRDQIGNLHPNDLKGDHTFILALTGQDTSNGINDTVNSYRLHVIITGLSAVLWKKSQASELGCL